MWLFQQLFPLVCYSLLNFFLLDSVVSNSFDTSFQLSNCHDDERGALLRFKQSFVIDRSVSVYEGAYPKVSSWKLDQEGRSNCCAWDGVECDEKTGHVIGLNLNSSCLFGSMNSSSSLFSLFYLRKLNLADNHFNFSPIPSAIGRFWSLTRLDLSDSRFSGQVPLQISHLSKLTFLDLSSRYDDLSKKWLLELQNPNLRSLIQNLTSLEWLHLESVYVPSTVPEFLANFSSLKWLLLANCGLYGEFPVNIFQISPSLEYLDLGWNKNLTGYLPEFHQPSPLTWLSLWDTSFSGNIPPSIGKLDSLQILYLRRCNFSRQLPSSLSNLTQLIWLDLGENHLGGYIPLFLQNLTQLTSLELDGNQMTGPIPSWLGNLNQLETLSLQDNNLNGYIPSSFQNLSQLSYLSLCANRLIGPIPSWLGNLTRLVHVYLYSNDLHGSIPHSLSKLMNLEQLHVQDNDLSGVVEFDMFFNMRSLVDLLLSNNNLSVVFEQRSMNATTSKFTHLGLGSCNLSEFPDFLRHQNKLIWLDLSANKIQGQIPNWMWNTSAETLRFLNLQKNSLEGFHEPSTRFFPEISLWELDLSFNMLQGQLPIPLPSITNYDISNNRLSGEISPLICNLSSLRVLVLSSNNFSGMVPQCLGKFNNLLSVLDLRNNSLHGAVPQVCAHSSNLRMMDFSHNKLQGKLPRSLAACRMLEYINLANNQLVDVFPSWLGTLPELKLLSLRHNRFCGVIKKRKHDSEFPRLRVIDISNNNFTGNLPSDNILFWNAMKTIDANDSRYMEASELITNLDGTVSVSGDYVYSTTIVNKGVERYYEVIQENFVEIDFSCNKFTGEIPRFIGDLKALRSLNFSFNILTGCLPSSLSNLTELESLDLSNNKLSGEIPQGLTRLTFLQSFDVSHNNFTGPIPQANQFGTFENTSFEGNPGLCGIPLSRKCDDFKALPRPPSAVEEDGGSGSPVGLDWIFVLAGGISGFVVGVALGDMVITKKPGWFVKAFRRTPPRRNIRQHMN